MIVTANKLREDITKLDKNKACCQDRISSEHIMYTSERILHMLAMCCIGFLIHVFLPDNMILVILTPVIKNKTGKITSKDNYRRIVLASVISKVFENVLFTRLEYYVLTKAKQFGFKSKHGTDMCIYALKEMVLKYRSLNSTMFLCFIDTSKAFDRINHLKLFEKLLK